MNTGILHFKQNSSSIAQLVYVSFLQSFMLMAMNKVNTIDVTSMHREYEDDTNQINLEWLWGSSWNKLTPKQRQMVSEILKSNKKNELLLDEV